MLLLLLLVSHPRLTIQVLFLGDPGPILIFGGPIFTKSFLNFEFLSYNLGGFAYFFGAPLGVLPVVLFSHRQNWRTLIKYLEEAFLFYLFRNKLPGHKAQDSLLNLATSCS